MDAELNDKSKFQDDSTLLLNSARDISQLLNSSTDSRRSEKGQPEFFQTEMQNQKNQTRRNMQIVSGRLDKESFA